MNEKINVLGVNIDSFYSERSHEGKQLHFWNLNL